MPFGIAEKTSAALGRATVLQKQREDKTLQEIMGMSRLDPAGAARAWNASTLGTKHGPIEWQGGTKDFQFFDRKDGVWAINKKTLKASQVSDVPGKGGTGVRPGTDPTAQALKRLGAIDKSIAKLRIGDLNLQDPAMQELLSSNPAIAGMLKLGDFGNAIASLERERQHLVTTFLGGVGNLPATQVPGPPGPPQDDPLDILKHLKTP